MQARIDFFRLAPYVGWLRRGHLNRRLLVNRRVWEFFVVQRPLPTPLNLKYWASPKPPLTPQ